LIKYIKGDATRPQAGPAIVAHICNNVGAYGAGFAAAVASRWPEAKNAYVAWHGRREPSSFGLGGAQLVRVESAVWVANMIAQDGLRAPGNPCPLKYFALEICLATVGLAARHSNASIHMPRIGCGLAGGSWDRVEPLIRREVCDKTDVDVFVYDLEVR
jgi:O-acetyl-ADP-ribose deacetylase (regulator of RNase III)